MITDTCCYYYSGDLGLYPLIQHGALHLDRFFLVFFVLYLFPLLVRSRSGKFLHVVGFWLMVQPICASASPTSFLYSCFFLSVLVRSSSGFSFHDVRDSYSRFSISSEPLLFLF